MTGALDKITEIVTGAGFTCEVGFGADILEFLESERTPGGGIVFVQIGSEVPDAVTQSGRARGFVGTFVLWMRFRAKPGAEAEAYGQYTSLRDALNGAEYDNGRHSLIITAGAVEIDTGFMQPQLTIEAVV